MRLVLISDTHNRVVKLPDGDVLIHAGDWTTRGTENEILAFVKFIASVRCRYKEVVVIAGNHDLLVVRSAMPREWLREAGVTYLQDSGTVIDGKSFWGSPWQPWFNDWAFNLPRGGAQLRQRWAWIPDTLDVLITHGPPHLILDKSTSGEHVGCALLRERVEAVNPLVHVFGHVHEAYGQLLKPSILRDRPGIHYVNAASCDLQYRPVNPPIIADI